jgi:hypothetical protein
MFSLIYALHGFQDRTAQVFDVTVASLTERFLSKLDGCFFYRLVTKRGFTLLFTT